MHYQWQKVLGWFQRAEAFVFVGTSFAVNVTAEALAQATYRRTRSLRCLLLALWANPDGREGNSR